MFLAWAGMIFAYLSEGVLIPMDRWIALLDDIMQDAPAFPSKGVEARVATAMLVATTMRQPSHPQAAHWAERAIEVARRHPDPFTRAIAAVAWFHHQLQAGDLAKVAAVVDEMRTVMRARDVSPIAAVNASMVVAWYEAATALPSYRRTVAQMLELAQTTGAFSSARHIALYGGLMGALSDGDLETSASWLQRAGTRRPPSRADVSLLAPLVHRVGRADPPRRRARGHLPARDAAAGPPGRSVLWTRRSPICCRPRCCTRGARREMREDISTVDSRSGAS